MTLTDGDRNTILQTSILLENKTLMSITDIDKFLWTCDIRMMLKDRGVDPLPRKVGRRLHRKMSKDMRSHLPVKSRMVFDTLLDVIERWIHQGHLPLSPAARVGLCTYGGCVLGCPRSVSAEGAKIFTGVGDS